MSAFGGYYITDFGGLDLTETPTIVPLSLQSYAFDNISYITPNTITIDETGIYFVMVTLCGRAVSSAPTTSIALELVINNIVQTNLFQWLEFNQLELHTFTFSNIIELFAGDNLHLQMSATSDTVFSAPLPGQTAALVVLRVA